MKQLVISCSLSTTSRSATLANLLAQSLTELDDETEMVDLRELPLPFCDAGGCYSDANVQMLSKKISDADAVSLAIPVYNYDVGGAARNLIAVTGSAWNDKIVGLMGAAGGERSYMSLMPVANSLMLDFRCVIVPRYVYASRAAFEDARLVDETIRERLGRLAAEVHRFAVALA
jgi:NAD(P)H-dependent FMN reductase